MIKAVIFDAGGTLIHMDRRFVIRVLNENGVAATLDDFARADQVARAVVAEIMKSPNPGNDLSRWTAYAAALMRELKCEGDALERVKGKLWAQHAAGDLWTYVLDGTFDLLESLRSAGYRLAIISNADGRVESFLEKAGLTKFFEFVLDSGVFGIEKPDVRIFEHALSRLDVRADEALYVGDVYEIDVIGARNAGMAAVLLNGSSAGWDCPVISSLPELLSLLQGDKGIKTAIRG